MRYLKQKLRMKLLILFLSLLTATITSGCKTTEIKPELPPRPEREYVGQLGTITDYALVIAYYEFLVEEWEAWADTVEEIVK